MQIESYIVLSIVVQEFGSAGANELRYACHRQAYIFLIRCAERHPALRRGCGFFATLRMTEEPWQTVVSGRRGRRPLQQKTPVATHLHIVHLKLTLDITSLLMFNYN